MKKKLVTGMGIIGLGVVLLSFANGEEPKMKRYEVIRSLNGEITTYDTLVAENSTFTPEQYLAQLGFANDQHVEIINMSVIDHQMMLVPGGPCMMHGMDSMRVMEFHGDPSTMKFHGDPNTMDSMIVIEMEINDSMMEWTGEGEPGQMIIEKNIVIKHVDSLNNEVVEHQQFIEVMILDSLIDPAMMMNGDSNIIIMQTIEINENGDGKGQENTQWTTINGEPTFERHTEDGNQRTDVIVFSEGEDFTLVIVSDGSQPATKSQLVIESGNENEGAFQLYPNPANKEVSVQLNFEEKATTKITVSDANGKIVMQLDLGDFSGNYTQTIDVSKWSKGIYFVNVDRPGVKLVEKLVVE